MVSRVFFTSSSAILPTTSLTTPSVSATSGGRESDDGLSAGAIVGIVVGILVGIAFITAILIMIWCRLVVASYVRKVICFASIVATVMSV